VDNDNILPPTGQRKFFGFSGGYSIASTLTPGKGYWVKASGTGTITLNATSASPKTSPAASELNELSRFTISDAQNREQSLYIGSERELKSPASSYELPPAHPAADFDARFVSQQMVESYSDASKQPEFTITVSANSYPVTVKYSINGDHVFTLSDGMGGRLLNNAVLAKTGSIRITNASVKSLVLKLVDDKIAVPKEFALHQNYPNPFNPSTRFDVDIPKTAEVDITVYDILGQKIATLLNGVQEAGYKTVEWNGANEHGLTVPSGMYFVRMTSEQFSAVRKVMMLK
jgi:hypothetical protein